MAAIALIIIGLLFMLMGVENLLYSLMLDIFTSLFMIGIGGLCLWLGLVLRHADGYWPWEVICQ